MRFGVVDYRVAYDPLRDKVCVNTTDTSPPVLYWYTREDLIELIRTAYHGRREIYLQGLRELPATEIPELTFS